MKELLGEEAIYTLHVFSQVLSWFLVIFATVGMVMYFAFPQAWSMANVIWDYYIAKKTPEYTITRSIYLKGGKLYNDLGWHDYLKNRVEYLQDTKKRPFELWILKDILGNIGEIKPKFTGKSKNKIRRKVIHRKDGVERRVKL